MTSPSDELRQAAAHIREVAGKASDAPWEFTKNEAVDGGVVANATYEVVHPGMDEDGDHIILWDPDVAELVAKLLTAAADHYHIPTDVDPELVALAQAINAKAGPR